jgi:5-methylthioadenosine/S-adenosylhomocysteine deaminase
MSLLLKNGLVLESILPFSIKRKNILIENGLIKKISPYPILSNASQKIDCTNKLILPAFINAHTHAPMSILRGFGEDLPLSDWLKNYMWPLEKKLSKEDVYWGTLHSIVQMFYCGTATFNEHYFFIESIIKAVKKAKIRSVLGYSMIDMGDFDLKGVKELEIAKKYINFILKLKNPLITPSINPHAPYSCSFLLLKECAKISKEYNLILHTHLAETKKEFLEIKKQYSTTPTKLLFKAGCLSKKSILAHSIYCTNEDISLIKNSDSSIAHCPVANFKLGCGSIAPIKKFLQNKINVAIGTDGPASNNSLNLLESAKFGLLAQKNYYSNPSVVSAEQFLYMLTLGGAKALGLNSGEIKEGKLADLVLLDLSSPELIPFSNNAGWIIYSASPNSISDLIINGEFVMKNKTILTLDVNLISKKVQKIKDKLIKYLN